jgi:hypothetical protein
MASVENDDVDSATRTTVSLIQALPPAFLRQLPI